MRVGRNWIFVIMTVPALVFGAGLATPRAAAAGPVLVFGAASLRNALGDAIAGYERSGGGKVIAAYAASSALARQLENGDDADIYISADLDWMNDVEKHHLIVATTRKNLLGNSLVLIAPRSGHAPMVGIRKGFDLRKLLGDGRLAMANPDAVPAGKYGKAALKYLGIWKDVKGRVAAAANVRAALLYVDRGETPYGIVYATDAASDKNVVVVGQFPRNSHPPIIYPVALMKTASKKAAARKFLAFIESPAAKKYFEKQGFTVLH
ncbi:MAG: molybdate ABC transporter substrate-binding protein [Stellaceae bacterium]